MAQSDKATSRASSAGRARAKPLDGSSKRAAYDALKEFEGKKYSGMKVGRGHKWQYAAGEWVEKKVTPDQWEFHYTVGKRRTGKAPEGSGVPVGTQYHWYILAHQTATKMDANNYETSMVGVKYKLNHKRADKGAWSASDRAQRKRLISILQKTIAELEREPDVEVREGTSTTNGDAEAGAPSGKGAAPKRARPPSRAAAQGDTGRRRRAAADSSSESALEGPSNDIDGAAERASQARRRTARSAAAAARGGPISRGTGRSAREAHPVAAE